MSEQVDQNRTEAAADADTESTNAHGNATTRGNPDVVGHGNTPAAWTGVIVLLVGTALICLGMVLNITFMWVAGIVGVLLGVLAWAGMNRMGYNVEKH